MDNTAVAQRFKTFLLLAVGLLLAVLLGFNIGSENYAPLLLGALIVGTLSIGLFLGESFWVLTIASSFLQGTFPALGGSFTPFQFMMAMGVARFLVGDIVLRRTPMRWGNRLDLILLTGFMGVLVAHGVRDRFGMRFLGSNIWGGRNYVNVFVGLAAFFIVQSIRLKPRVWAKLPFAVLCVIAFDVVITIITTVFPSTIYKIYPFYSGVSLQGIQELLGTPEAYQLGETTTRLGVFGTFGFCIILIVLASISLPRLFSLADLPRLFWVGLGGIAVLFSSFRTSVIQTLLAVLVAGVRDLKWMALSLLPLLAILLACVSIINSEFVELPKPVQRSLQFIPGRWDPQMQGDAAASNEFRQRLWTVFLKEYFPEHRWFGRGFGFRSAGVQASVYVYNPNWDRDAVEVGNIHSGFFATLDAIGIVGTFFFIFWNLRLLRRIFRVSVRRKDPAVTALRFLGLYLAVVILFYWMGASTVGTLLPQEFALAGVFLRLQQTVESDDRKRDPVSAPAAVESEEALV